MHGEGANTLDGCLQMAILLYRSYYAHTSFCLTFWGDFLAEPLDEIAGG